jgi:putative flippase GtrA
MMQHFLSRQFLGFLAVGGLAALLHWLSRLLLSVWLPFVWAVGLAYGVGMAVAFVLNSRFVFPASSKSRHTQVRDFVLVNLVFFPLVWLASLAVNELLGALGMRRHTEELAHAIAIAMPMCATFLIYKFHTFGEPRHG